jgi:hypothetical protein
VVFSGTPVFSTNITEILLKVCSPTLFSSHQTPTPFTLTAKQYEKKNEKKTKQANKAKKINTNLNTLLIY